MENILILGAGRIGKLISLLLKQANYTVILADVKANSPDVEQLDITDQAQVEQSIKQHKVTAIVVCLPYFHTITAAKIASTYQLHYFDLTEDIAADADIELFAQHASSAFVPHCGIAPGFSGLLAHHLIQQFSQVDQVRIRVGGLPQYSHNKLHYAITWSIDGLINEYGNPCQSLEQGKITYNKSLSDIEELELDGMQYEAFNTSGGLGNLIKLYEDKINHMSYKTIRYPGHCKKMRFLMNDLKLNSDRETLKHILENALPETTQDILLAHISVIGNRDGRLHEESIVKKYYPRKIQDHEFSALQITTAASACAVIDHVLQHKQDFRGLVYQETISLVDLQKSQFYKYIS